MPFITIFTPTYNRETTLVRLYKSLCEQTFNDFEWLVIDDGSIDNTQNVINTWIKEKRFEINYYYQENSGKHIAYNKALSKAKGKYFFCVDSDDWLPQDSIYTIWNRLHQGVQNNIIGLIGQKELPNGTFLSPKFPQNISSCNTLELVQLYGCKGEWTIIFETKKALKYPFPVIENESFAGESIIYDLISKSYDFILDNHVLTTCEYQQDGLSRNIHRIMMKNPGGYKIFYGNRIDMALNFQERLGYILRYWIFSFLYGKNDYPYQGKHLNCVNFMRPFGFCAYLLFKYKFS
jgi:glycosyltransferase involved in cell wall biosynthesis